MSQLKIAIIVCASVLTLATGAQALDLRIGNGSTTVTIPSNGGTTDRAYSRSRSSTSDFQINAANGAR
jgi:hypothetical protein